MTTERPRRPSPFALEHPAFGDEMQRRTWMESYVVAFEVSLLTASAVAAAMVWFDGVLAMWSLAVLAVVGAGNLAALWHLRSAGMEDLSWADRWRFWPFRVRLLLIAVWLVGFVRHALADTFGGVDDLTPSYLAGAVVGGGVVLLAMVVTAVLARRRTRRELPEDDTFDD